MRRAFLMVLLAAILSGLWVAVSPAPAAGREDVAEQVAQLRQQADRLESSDARLRARLDVEAELRDEQGRSVERASDTMTTIFTVGGIVLAVLTLLASLLGLKVVAAYVDDRVRAAVDTGLQKGLADAVVPWERQAAERLTSLEASTHEQLAQAFDQFRRNTETSP